MWENEDVGKGQCGKAKMSKSRRRGEAISRIYFVDFSCNLPNGSEEVYWRKFSKEIGFLEEKNSEATGRW